MCTKRNNWHASYLQDKKDQKVKELQRQTHYIIRHTSVPIKAAIKILISFFFTQI